MSVFDKSQKELDDEMAELVLAQTQKDFEKVKKQQEKKFKKFKKQQAKVYGIEQVEIKEVKEEQKENKTISTNTTTQENIAKQENNDEDFSLNNSLKDYLKGYDKDKKMLRYMVIISNLYKVAASGSKEAIRSIITILDRMEGRPGINNTNGDEDKENPLAQEIHNLAEIVRNKKVKTDGEKST